MQCFTKVRSKAKNAFVTKASYLPHFILEIAGFLNVCGNRLGSWALRLKHAPVMFTPRIITITLKFDHSLSEAEEHICFQLMNDKNIDSQSAFILLSSAQAMKAADGITASRSYDFRTLSCVKACSHQEQ